MHHRPLKERVMHMARWTLLGFGAAQVLRLSSNLILTRLLSPDAFGVMSIGMAVVVALAMLSDLGLEAALVQRQGELTAKFTNTIWSLQIVRGAGIGACLFTVALAIQGAQWMHWIPPGSTFIAPQLPGVLAILALAPVISGFDSTRLVLANRNLAVARLIQIQFVDALFATVVTVAIAWWMRSVYAMPLGWLAGASLRLALSHSALPGEPNKWCWDPDSRSEIHRTGKWIFLSTAMTFFINGGDRLMLGYFLNSQQMGLYAIAFMLASTAQTLLHKVNSVGLPMFSEVTRSRPNELRAIFKRIRLPVDLVSLVIAGVLAGMAPLIIKTMYDSRYAGAAPMLTALSLIIVATRYDLLTGCWIALGKPQRLTVLSLVRMLTLLIFLPLGYYAGGPTGAAWGIGASAMTNHVVGWIYMKDSGLWDWQEELKPLPAAVLGYAIGWLATNWLG
jgi:O-antigen/teichoic acid export membrane protein